MNTDELKLTDNAINHIAKLLQMAILTGTDIMDNLRSATLVSYEGKVDIHPDHQEAFENNIQAMLDELGDTSPEEDFVV